MQQLKQYCLAEKLEQALGNPESPDNIMSYKQVVDIDESEAFPHEQVNWLYNWKLQNYYVPQEYGGEFTSFEEFVAIVRVLCRRDQTIGIAFTTMFWSFITWMAGTPEQKAWLSNYMRNENGAMCLGYSEREHGADLTGGDLSAKKVDGGYLLNGEKWPINRATISGISYILAKTEDSTAARSLSLFMVDKSRLNPDQYYNLPKILTHGIRASDMSGIGFKDCFVPDDMLLKEEGAGLELALKGFQITRTLCSAFSHGAADTALRTTLKFALSREVYGTTVFQMPQPRHTLVNGFLDLLICECETIASARGFHVVPQQFSVWAAVVKYFVTIQLENMINDISVVLGSRFYMREEHDSGIFQKVLRDNSIISVFDGSSVVNLHALLLQFRQISKSRSRRNDTKMEQIGQRLNTIFALDQELPKFEPEKLELVGRGADDVLQGLEITLDQLKMLKEKNAISPEIIEPVIALTQAILEELDAHDRLIANSAFEYGHNQSPELFELAKKYCTLHAAASCVQMWVYNRENLDEFFAEGKWLILSLNRLLAPFGRSHPVPAPYMETVAQQLVKLYEQKQMFSIVPFQLATL
ncbi:acyl-CoA dehydrogenase family protein [Roseofilum sp. Belize Diploria]|uniref:acyl-CoA dehydrogenase family protein n=2 Tax=unclassified Roseofilum TaxID=2620099 RepID=UPI000E96D21E|nr:acyl-CoA dehydrogenase family protein [Roseofilum sp. Belize Diploria]MBP0008347.1 acyl-CoA dehydrogenase family protein [Roseofilum sp. Belize Diploria]HBQ99660.1 isovaleryl-CoA dehydrogenase [Cyanobacteria bacterium UBA11691]